MDSTDFVWRSAVVPRHEHGQVHPADLEDYGRQAEEKHHKAGSQ
jgi:hypothetical protein